MSKEDGDQTIQDLFVVMEDVAVEAMMLSVNDGNCYVALLLRGIPGVLRGDDPYLKRVKESGLAYEFFYAIPWLSPHDRFAFESLLLLT